MPRTRVLLAKPGLDGHDRGVLVLAAGLRDAGCEVIYLGRRARPEMIVAAALQEDVDVIGLSILSGAHLGVTADVVSRARAEGIEDIPILVGGTIPDADVPRLLELGAAAAFPTSSRLDQVVGWLRDRELLA